MTSQSSSIETASTWQRVKSHLTNRSTIGFFISIAIIALVAIAFFYPDGLQGGELRQHDTLQGLAISHEVVEHEAATGEVSRWTNALFGGMPTFQIAPSYSSGLIVGKLGAIYRLGLPSPVSLLFIMMTGFFILLLAMKVKWPLALPGAIAYGLSSYFIIIIGAGHIWKFITLAYVPPTIAGMVLAYRGRYVTGCALAALFAMLQIAGNHIQMSYYFLMVVLGFAVAYGIILFRQHRMARWWKATGALAVAAILAVAANAPNLYCTYQYSKESMRGRHSELTQPDADADNATSGLDRDYITQWSYGKSETLSLLIPNIKGGATIKPEKGTNKLMAASDTDTGQSLANSGSLSSQERAYLSQFPQYFGDQPMTNGPVYVGALIFALALLGCVIVKGPIKWMLVVVTILSIALSWGHNMMWLTDLMIDYMPMYNKFRTVASILVVAEFTIPLLAILALRELIDHRDDRAQYKLPVFITFGLCALLCLIGIVAPSVYGSYLSAQEQEAYISTGIVQQAPGLFAALENVRMSLVSADALRSLMIVAIGGIMVALFMTRRISSSTLCVAVTLVVVADLYTVNKRYVNTDSFVTPMLAGEPIPMTPADKSILADTAMNYRVMDIPRFGDAAPSYRHKTIGGYHAAKLTRYQDLINRHLSNFQSGNPTEADMNVLNMLNAKYIVVSQEEAILNPDALGNAWFVDSLFYANGPDAEMQALDFINPASTAVADARFTDILGAPEQLHSSTPGDTIYETSYAPNELHYVSRSANGGIAVFSEVYFPWGWEATIDGNPTPLARVNYLLRAMKVPAGTHTIVMRFDPPQVHTTVAVATTAVIIILILSLLAAVIALVRKP